MCLFRLTHQSAHPLAAAISLFSWATGGARDRAIPAYAIRSYLSGLLAVVVLDLLEIDVDHILLAVAATLGGTSAAARCGRALA